VEWEFDSESLLECEMLVLAQPFPLLQVRTEISVAWQYFCTFLNTLYRVVVSLLLSITCSYLSWFGIAGQPASGKKEDKPIRQ
jgi:hypothetical protein